MPIPQTYPRIPLLSLVVLLLAACQGGGAAPAATQIPVTPLTCGNGACDPGETSSLCPLDCPGLHGRVETIYVNSENIGRIAVQVVSPQQPRFPEGSGVVVLIPPIFTPGSGFLSQPDFTSIGLIQITFLWPGIEDQISRLKSDGEYDYGGELSLQVLRDVIRFAAGRQADTDGRYLVSLTNASPLQNEVGLYAFGDAGLAAVGVLSEFGDKLPGLVYYVGRENPSVDSLICQEIGYYDTSGQPVVNPFYLYPASNTPRSVNTSYTGLRWEAAFTEPGNDYVGRPYLDLDASGTLTGADYLFDGAVPVVNGKRTYSAALTQALLDSGALTAQSWPADLATPPEASQVWSARQTSHRFEALRETIQALKVMLVFAQLDHAQVAPDKPHIHQLFQGFRFEADLWVRLNPDRTYVTQILPAAGLDFPDNPANTQPQDWTQIDAYSYPNQGQADEYVPLAAVAEMADRAHADRWDENLGQVLFTYTQPTPQP
jgi:hypothetical protein